MFAALEHGCRAIVVDLTATSFVDSTFLGLLITAQERLAERGGEISLVCSDANIRKIFAITGLDHVLAIDKGAGYQAPETPRR